MDPLNAARSVIQQLGAQVADLQFQAMIAEQETADLRRRLAAYEEAAEEMVPPDERDDG